MGMMFSPLFQWISKGAKLDGCWWWVSQDRPDQSLIVVLEIEPSLCTWSATGPRTFQFALDKGFLSPYPAPLPKGLPVEVLRLSSGML